MHSARDMLFNIAPFKCKFSHTRAHWANESGQPPGRANSQTTHKTTGTAAAKWSQITVIIGSAFWCASQNGWHFVRHSVCHIVSLLIKDVKRRWKSKLAFTVMMKYALFPVARVSAPVGLVWSVFRRARYASSCPQNIRLKLSKFKFPLTVRGEVENFLIN